MTILFLLAFPCHIGAQEDGRSILVQRLEPGKELRLDVSGVGRAEGRLLATSATTLTLSADGSTILVPVPDIDTLWVRGRSSGKGAVIGGLAGLAAGIVGGLLIASVACEPVDGGDCTTLGVTAVSALVGGAGGALVGAGVGLAIPAWHLKFP